MLLFELDFEEVSKKKLRECWSQLCRIRCTVGSFPELRLSYNLLVREIDLAFNKLSLSVERLWVNCRLNQLCVIPIINPRDCSMLSSYFFMY